MVARDKIEAHLALIREFLDVLRNDKNPFDFDTITRADKGWEAIEKSAEALTLAESR